VMLLAPLVLNNAKPLDASASSNEPAGGEKDAVVSVWVAVVEVDVTAGGLLESIAIATCYSPAASCLPASISTGGT
jgi:hypothetical protein